MSATSLAPAIELFRRGDLVGARAAAETALAEQPDEPAILGLAGLLAAQMGDPEAALPHFRHLLALAPDDRAARVNLATALLATGDLAEASRICAAGGDDPKLGRIAAYVHQQQGRLEEAAAAYDAVLAAFPDDFESWNNSGNVHAARGDGARAISAFERAIALRPDVMRIYFNLSEALAKTERSEARRRAMREAARIAPEDAEVQAELGLAESAVRDFAAAEAAFRAAIRLSPGFTPAFLEFGLLLENLNRVADLAALVGKAEARGLAGPEIGFLKAWSLRRQGRLEEALPLAEATPASINPIRRAQLLAELHDRLGNPDRAFGAFIEMNEAAVAAKPQPEGPTYREEVVSNAALLTPSRVAAWRKIAVERVPPAPVFIVGFPRSGTTLLDTLLMNIPSLHVLEEMPVLRQVELAIGEDARLATLAPDEAAALRSRYFQALGTLSSPDPDQTIVDKHPLTMTRMPIVNRIFPDAKVVLVERHPCDAVLSCFMSNFQLNRAMRSFVNIEEAARTYDAVFESWTRAISLLPIDFHAVRYERMVDDLESEMRGLLGFLGIPWDPKVLDNRASAAKREHIRTASYSQVTEPIYRRSAGRWERYRAQLDEVLPILAPWAERMGYPM